MTTTYPGPTGLLARNSALNTAAPREVWYTFDILGNVAQRLDEYGTVRSSDSYDAYGRLLTGGDPADPYGYKGQYGYYTDHATGLILCTHRYYDPATGGWLTRDPIGYDGGLNLYGYCGGDPVGLVDPDGKDYSYGTHAKPNIVWDNSFKRNHKMKPRTRDYLYAKAFRVVPYIPGLVGREAKQAYKHYRDNTGTDMYMNYQKAYIEDSVIRHMLDTELISACQMAEIYHKKHPNKKHYIFVSDSIEVSTQNHNNWKYAIGNHRAWIECNVWVKGNEYYMIARVRFEDKYNFNPGAFASNGLPDNINGRFEALGWAKSFMSWGSFHMKYQWKKGNYNNAKIGFWNLYKDGFGPKW